MNYTNNFKYTVDQKFKTFLFRKNIYLKLKNPVISFTFDDCPMTAIQNGARILEYYDKVGTFYISFGLLDNESPSGRITDLNNIEKVLKRGHDIGDHTFNHIKAEAVENKIFEEQIVLNRDTLEKYFPGYKFSSFSYPFGSLKPVTKKIVQKYYGFARGSFHGINRNITDSLLLKSFRLYGTSERKNIFKIIIDENKRNNGWLIFYTHDVSSSPSAYGCDEKLFDFVINYALKTQSEILSVAQFINKFNSVRN